MPTGPLKSFLLAIVAGVITFAQPPALAQETATFNIPSQDLAAALRQFAVVTSTEILYTPDLVANLRSLPLVGEYTAEEALRRLLADTGLSFEDAAPGVIVLKRVGEPAGDNGAPSSPAADATPRVLNAQYQVPAPPATGSAGPGALSGVVRDAATGAPLAGARVWIRGTGLESVSNERGRYRFPEVPAGRHVVEVDYLGTAFRPVDVSVEPGATTVSDLVVGDSSLETIVVLGYRSSLQRALNQERTAANSATVVSADLLGGFPAETVSEALRRVPGVAFGRSDETGEGSRITIRGFSSEAINVQLNGLDLQGTGFERTIDLSGFLADNISSVTIHKTLLPSHEATGSGGLVEIETKSGLDYGDFQFHVATEAESSFESEFGDEQQGNLLFAKKLTDTFGIAATVQYRRSDRRNYDVAVQGRIPPVYPAGHTSDFTVPASQQFPWDPEFESRMITSAGYTQRDRDVRDVAASLNAAWDVTDRTRLRLDLQRNVNELSTGVSRTTAGFFVTAVDMPIEELGGEIRRRATLGTFRPTMNVTAKDYELVTDTISFRGDTDIERWKFEYKLGYSHAQMTGKTWDVGLLGAQATNTAELIDPATLTTQTDDDPDATERVTDGAFVILPNGVVAPSLSDLGRDAFLDPAVYSVNRATHMIYDSPTDAMIAEGSARYEFAPGLLQYVELGLKYDRSERDSLDDTFASPGVGALTPVLTYASIFGVPTTLADLDPGLASNRNLDAIGAGGVTAPFLSSNSAHRFFDALANLVEDDPSTAFNEQRFTVNDLRGLDPLEEENALSPASTVEERLATWLQAEVQLGDFSIVGGARIERTDRSSTALSWPRIRLPDSTFEPWETFVEADLVEFASISGTDTTVTPSLLANWRPNDNTVVRLGYFRSTVNPDFRLLRRQTQYLVDMRPTSPAVIVREGNPDLQATTTDNFDLDVAYYFADSPGLVRAGLFYKDIDNNFTNVLTADLPGDTATMRERYLEYLQPLAGTRPDLLDLPADTVFLLNRPENGEGGKIWGAEVSVIRELDFLPGFLRDFGILANATYTDGDFPTLVSGFDDDGNFTDFSLDRPLRDQSEWVYNASLNYARGDFEGRLIYTYQSESVASYSVHDLNTVIPSYSTLDCRLSWSFEGPYDGLITVFLEGDDLLNGAADADIRSTIEPTFGRGDADYSFPQMLQFNGGRTITAGIVARF